MAYGCGFRLKELLVSPSITLNSPYIIPTSPLKEFTVVMPLKKSPVQIFFVLRFWFTGGGGATIHRGVGVGPGSAVPSTSSTSRRESIKIGAFWADNIIVANPLLLPMDLV